MADADNDQPLVPSNGDENKEMTREEVEKIIAIYDGEKQRTNSTLALVAVVMMFFTAGLTTYGVQSLKATQEIVRIEQTSRMYELQNDRLKLGIHEKLATKEIEMNFKLAEVALNQTIKDLKESGKLNAGALRDLVESLQMVKYSKPIIQYVEQNKPKPWAHMDLSDLILSGMLGFVFICAVFMYLGYKVNDAVKKTQQFIYRAVGKDEKSLEKKKRLEQIEKELEEYRKNLLRRASEDSTS